MSDILDRFQDDDFSIEQALLNQFTDEYDGEVSDSGQNYVVITTDHGDLFVQVTLDMDNTPEWSIHAGSAEYIKMQDIFISPNNYVKAADEYFRIIRETRFSEPMI